MINKKYMLYIKISLKLYIHNDIITISITIVISIIMYNLEFNINIVY